jgi:hypothetical protein
VNFTLAESSDKMNMNKPHILANYWSGIHTALNGRLLSVKDYLHHPSSGLNAENYFRDLLRQYLPRRFSVESGFVANANGERSDLHDVLIVDRLNIPPLSAESYFKVFPAEAVVGAVEITSAPKTSVKRSGHKEKITKLEDDILKLAKLRRIADNREYLHTVATKTAQGIQLVESRFSYSLSPRSFLITCGDEWSKSETFEKQLLGALTRAKQKQDQKHVWINAVLSMRHGMFHFIPYTEFEFNSIKDNAMLEFFFFVNNVISGFFTSHIDLRRYRPTIPDEPKKNGC